MKTKILKILRNSKGYVSGQEMCEQLHVSRTAVWKVMNQLKEEGYVIEAVSNRGYQLIESPDTVTDYEVLSQMKTKVIGQKVVYFDTTDSTNQQAKIIAEEKESHGILVTAEVQNSGRGRRGRTWLSPRGTGIWMSLVLKPTLAPENASMLTLVTALAIVKAMEENTNLSPKIKWPNDIILNGRKVCGILTEMSSELDYIHYIIVGIGINGNTEAFEDEIAKVATSIKIEQGTSVNRSAIIAAVMATFEEYYERFLETNDLSQLKEEYNSYLVHKGVKVRILNGAEEYEATALGIDERGELVVECLDRSIKKVRSGEVSVRGINGYAE